MSLRVLLVDDHALARKGLTSLISSLPDTVVVGEAASGREAVECVGALAPTVVLMDVSMKCGDGIWATQAICEAYPDCRVIGLSMHESGFIVRQMLSAGAMGYIAKSAPVEEIIAGLKQVSRGERFISSTIEPAVLDPVNGNDDTLIAGGNELSQREREVLQLIASGLSSKQIAMELYITEKTVAYHRQHLMKKLKVYSVAELTRYAMRAGLVAPVE